MMSDMLIRLFQQQPKVNDPADLEGVIFIDEIDIHLHPKFQKHLVVQLSRAFPNIQFIVTTHSPIPLLGAPKNSCIFVAKRNASDGVILERVDDKLFLEELLPNTILSSPIFGMADITNEFKEDQTRVRVEDTYEEVLLMDTLKKEIKSFMNNEKEERLIERIKKRYE